VDSIAGRRLRLAHAGKPLLETHHRPRRRIPECLRARPGDAHVYLWRGRLVSVVDRPVDGWRDKRIAALEPDSIAALDVVRGKDRYSLKRPARAGR